MPNGLMPAYSYRPQVKVNPPFMKTRSSRRARLFLGGTYFRARDPGGKGNNISIEVMTVSPGIGKMIVTNHNTVQSENVIGPADVVLIEQQLKWDERFQIEQLTTTPIARRYSISWQIAAGMTLAEEIGQFAWNALLHIPSKLSVKLTPRTSEFTPTSVITIKPRVRVYDLTYIPADPGVPAAADESGVTLTSAVPGHPEGWDIEALRSQVNLTDPWIEMMPRSGTAAPKTVGGVVIPPPPPHIYDYQDNEVDDPVMVSFGDTYLTGGDGLPDTPSVERTGPTRSLAFINYGEAYDGSLGGVNTIYEWAGENTSSGNWKTY